jgi:TusA-related sulfurtransferase
MTHNIKHAEIDATGLACPLPLLKLKLWLAMAEPGQRVRLLASDPGSQRDIPNYLLESSHQLIHSEHQADLWIADIEAGEQP